MPRGQQAAHHLQGVGVDRLREILRTGHAALLRSVYHESRNRRKTPDDEGLRGWARSARRGLPRPPGELYTCTGPEPMSAIRQLAEFASCGGRTAVVQVEAPEGGSLGLGLASLIAELEAAGDPVRTVELRQSDRAAAEAIADAIEWVAAHGRRAIVRAAVPLGRSAVAAARRHGATVILEIAHPDPAAQKVLLGDGAESSATLLLHAQHLRACEIEVAAQIGPLLPAIHDDRTVATLVHHVVAADLVDAHLTMGRLTHARLLGLGAVLPWPQVATMARAFGVDPGAEHPV
ncbi:MAG TPA: hypothetical protein VG755_20695, partial [Nannocystaceae bacterium]|nr:hypothetical protein [Nannocystaceae bacterium]